MESAVTVACVLRSGGDFNIDHVLRLREMVFKNVKKVPVTFLVLADQNVPGVADIRPMVLYPAQWQQLELFSPGFCMKKMLYLDLDVSIRGNIDEIVRYEPEKLMLIRDVNGNPSSTAMLFTPAIADKIWRTIQRYEIWPGKFPMLRSNKLWKEIKPDVYPVSKTFFAKYTEYGFLNDVFPERFASYKREFRKGKAPNASIVYYHGLPRPWSKGE